MNSGLHMPEGGTGIWLGNVVYPTGPRYGCGRVKTRQIQRSRSEQTIPGTVAVKVPHTCFIRDQPESSVRVFLLVGMGGVRVMAGKRIDPDLKILNFGEGNVQWNVKSKSGSSCVNSKVTGWLK